MPAETLPTISLVTPVLDSARYLEETLRSVLGQRRALLRLPGPDLPAVIVYRNAQRRWERRSGWRTRIPKWGAPEI